MSLENVELFAFADQPLTYTVDDEQITTPTPVKCQANLGVLEEKSVDVNVHGHEPALSDMLAAASETATIFALNDRGDRPSMGDNVFPSG